MFNRDRITNSIKTLIALFIVTGTTMTGTVLIGPEEAAVEVQQRLEWAERYVTNRGLELGSPMKLTRDVMASSPWVREVCAYLPAGTTFSHTDIMGQTFLVNRSDVGGEIETGGSTEALREVFMYRDFFLAYGQAMKAQKEAMKEALEVDVLKAAQRMAER